MYWLRHYEYGVDPSLEWHWNNSSGKWMPPSIDKVSYMDKDNDSGECTVVTAVLMFDGC